MRDGSGLADRPALIDLRDHYIPFVHKSLQNYNDFVWTVTRLNRDMNYSLAAVGLLIRKPGPHNSRGSVGPLK